MATARAALALAVLSLLAAGCQVRVDAGIELQPDDVASVDLTIGIRLEEGFPSDVPTEDAMSVEDTESEIADLASTCGFDASAADITQYDEDGFMGVNVALDSIPLDAVNCFFTEQGDDQFFQSFELERDGDEYVFAATIPDLTQGFTEAFSEGFSEGLGGQKRQVAAEGDAPLDEDALGDALEEGFGEALQNPEELFEITIRVTFPGNVGENNATRVEGTTAIWEVGAGETQLMARGEASEGGGLGGTLLWVLVGILFLAGLGLILFLVLRGRNRTSPTDTPAYQGGPPGTGVPPGHEGAHFPPAGGPGTVPPQGAPGQAPPPGVAPGGPPPASWGGTPPVSQTPPPPGDPGGWGQSPQAPQPPPPQPQAPPPPVPDQSPPPPAPEGPADGGEPPARGATRTFRPQDLLPPDEGQRPPQ